VNEVRLTIGYSVLAARAADIQLPPIRSDVEILVVVQGRLLDGAPVRDDVRWLQMEGFGVARSRNEVLRRARGEFILFADDDARFDDAGVRVLQDALERDAGLSLALGSTVDETSTLRKRYPRRSVPLSRWNSAKAATYEMMLRREAFLTAGISFDESFGAGAEHYLGDEYIVIADALRAGLRCRFFPAVVAVHPKASSGTGFGTARDAAARAAVFGRVFGRAAFVARLAFVLRSPRRFGSVPLTARFVAGRLRG